MLFAEYIDLNSDEIRRIFVSSECKNNNNNDTNNFLAPLDMQHLQIFHSSRILWNVFYLCNFLGKY